MRDSLACCDFEAMKLSAEDVRHVAQLARLRLNDDQLRAMSDTMSAILSYMDTLNEVDTSRVSPTSYIGMTETAFREDEVGSSLPLDDALANAPDRVGAFYRVPKIIE